MKIIKYNLATNVNCGTDEAPEMMELLSAVTLEYSEENLAIAQNEAHNGEYTIEDDGKPEPKKEISSTEEAFNIFLGV